MEIIKGEPTYQVIFEVELKKFPEFESKLLLETKSLEEAEATAREYAKNSVYRLQSESYDCQNLLCIEGLYGVAWYVKI